MNVTAIQRKFFTTVSQLYMYDRYILDISRKLISDLNDKSIFLYLENLHQKIQTNSNYFLMWSWLLLITNKEGPELLRNYNYPLVLIPVFGDPKERKNNYYRKEKE